MNAETGEPALLGTNSLPFGATGSVSSFLGVSVALWYIGVRALGLCWTAFFDDYTLLSRRCIAENTGRTAAGDVVNLVGVDFAREGKKCTNFDTVVKTLGVELNLCDPEGRVLLGHTENRRSELANAVGEIIEKGKIDTKFAESLRGRMQWFEGYVFGRTAQRCVRTVGESLRCAKSSTLTSLELTCFRDLQERVLSAPRIEIPRTVLDTWIVFTDGACEGAGDKVGSIGGVLINPYGYLVEYFSSKVPTVFMLKLCETSANPIYELELLPVLVSYLCWRKHLANSPTVFYSDNDAARAGLTKALGATQQAEAIVHHVTSITSIESEICNKPWYGRVPTASNIADDPSRLDCSYLDNLGCQRCEVDWASSQMQVI